MNKMLRLMGYVSVVAIPVAPAAFFGAKVYEEAVQFLLQADRLRWQLLQRSHRLLPGV
jgi:hypothetical protein